MTDISQHLADQADRVRPDPNLGDVLRRARHRRRRSMVRRSIAFVVLGFVVVGLATIRRNDGSATVSTPTVAPATPTALDGAPSIPAATSPDTPVATTGTGPPSPLPSVSAIAAAAIDGPTAHVSEAGGNPGLQRHDATAVNGPFSTVVRRSDGAFGIHSAVITAQIDPPQGGEPVVVGQTTGVSFVHEVDWQIGSTWVRIRSDLPPGEMVALADATTLSPHTGNRPIVNAPAGFAVAYTGQFISTDVNEFRYGSIDVGEGGSLGSGLTYTGVYSGAAFEDRLLGQSVVHFVDVPGHAAVASAIQGGDGTLAWEASPGIVVYVGYSGWPFDDAAIAGLTRLAARSTFLDSAQWSGLRPQVVQQSNDV